MIAHIRQSQRPESQPPDSRPPIVRARHIVAETLLPDESAKLRRRTVVRKALLVGGLFGGLALLAAVVALAYYSWR